MQGYVKGSLFSERIVVVNPYEAERYVSELKVFQIEEFGSVEWFKQHQILEKLNLQVLKDKFYCLGP